MKESDHLLERLFADARQVSDVETSAMPLGFAKRVVRRAFGPKEQTWLAYFPMMRVGIAVAVGALCVSILVNLPVLKQATPDLAELAIQHHLTSLVLSAR